MKRKFIIADQDDAQANLDWLATESARLESIAGSTAPARPKLTGDILQDAENLEAHNANLQVTTRLRPAPQPPAKVSPASSQAVTAPAVAVAGVKVTAPAAVRLNATQRAMAALGKALLSPAPSRMTATERCRAALATKVKAAAPAPPAKVFVPMPLAFADKDAALREIQNACGNLEIGMRSKGKTFQRPALTGDHAADVAALESYRAALQTSFLSTVRN